MKTIFIPLLMVSSIVHAECPGARTPDEMYSKFCSTSFFETGRNEKGEMAAKERVGISSAEAKEAWACLNEAAENDHCGAIFVLELYYRRGVQSEVYGFEKSAEEADMHEKQYRKLCMGNT